MLKPTSRTDAGAAAGAETNLRNGITRALRLEELFSAEESRFPSCVTNGTGMGAGVQDASSASPRGATRQRLLFPLVVVASGGYLLALTFGRRGIPFLIGGDQGFPWVHAHRMLRGELPYRDFFQFTAPGADVLFAAAFSLVGERMWVTNAIVVAVGVAVAAVCFIVASQVLSRASAAQATAAVTVLVYGPALRVSPHHWLSVLAIMSAVGVLGSGTSRARLIGAGVLLGLASFFTQTHGVVALVAFVALEAWKSRRDGFPLRRLVQRLAMLVGGFVGAIAVEYAYFVPTAGLARMWECLFVYVRLHVRRTTTLGLGLPEALTPTTVRWLAPYLSVYAMAFVGYVITPALARAEHGGKESKTLAVVWLCWLVGVALLAEVLVALSWGRFFAVSLPGVILFVWAIERSGRARRALVASTWLVIVVFGCLIVRANAQRHSLVFQAPAGTLLTDAATAEKLAWVGSHTRGDGSFFAADEPSLYLPLGLTDPVFLVAVVPAHTTPPAQIRELIAELETSRIPQVLWPPRLVEAEDDRAGIPSLSAYIHARYRLAHTFAGGDEAWERR
jgi:hypothetical protein